MYMCLCVHVRVFEGILRFNLDPFIINSEQHYKYFILVTMINEHFARIPSTLLLLLLWKIVPLLDTIALVLPDDI